MDFSAYRDRLYDWLRDCLIGRSSAERGADELNGIRPLDRYHTGILFPVVRGEYGLDQAAEEGDAGGESDAGDDDEEGDSTSAEQAASPRKRRFVPPSSVGFSFFVAGDPIALQLIPRAVHYARCAEERDAAGRYRAERWTRVPLGEGESEVRGCAPPDGRRTLVWRETVFAGRAELLVLWRALESGWLVTVSLSNRQTPEHPKDGGLASRERNAKALLETSLVCHIDAGEVGPYPGLADESLTPEEQELELRYRHHRVYAVGHGAAVDWDLRDGRVTAIRTEFLPRVEVPQVSTEIRGLDEDTLSLDWLAQIEQDRAGCCVVLERFVAGYADWVSGVAGELGGFAGARRAAAQRIHGRMESAVQRMGAGVRRLREDALAARAFGMANGAMHRQMAQADRAAGRAPRERYRWRPFQLAFLLLTLESILDEHSEHRDTLDLIWFPTGGGKTEAYLGLMALLICWRRLKFGASGGGTAVLMRYTLRLLTKDQFRRAARLICALELLRRETPGLGAEPITLGLWVGGDSSPNTFMEAKEAADQAAEDGARPPSLLVLDACPWCGRPFPAGLRYDAGPRHFRFCCASPGCDFGREVPGTLPCNVVDTALYAAPPTLLLATVDKCARLAWEERAGAFFGVGNNRPPELVIQDELHLIASALGSVGGLYEAGIETVLAVKGLVPKYIASTATIRMAEDQVRRLYGREAAVFPAPGLDCDDSYFARTLPLTERPGRLYVGFLAPARDRAHCLAPLAGALLAAPEVLFGEGYAERDALLDAWWTLLVYHGSLKGVGTSRNALADIETFVARYQAEAREQGRGADPGERTEDRDAEPWRRLERLAERLTQLTSHMSADANAATFDRLRLPRTHPDALDLVLATNMVSVGLDVSRLAAMAINGQPLTTAEYIQASSRVGRGEVPGLVIVNYYRDQARSLSHYESFRAYHESFYRYVEPTSVTPYTYQARLRALHAALTIAVRHGDTRFAENAAAGRFDAEDAGVRRILDELKRRCRCADPERAAETAEHLDALARQWADAAGRARERRERLVYAGSGGDHRDQRLLYAHGSPATGLWATLNSMRNVENTSLVKIL